MNINHHNSELDHLARLAGALLGQPALPLELRGVDERDIDERAVLRAGHRLPCLLNGRRRSFLGAVEYRLAVPEEADIRLVRIERPARRWSSFWANVEDYRRFPRAVRWLQRAPSATLAEDAGSCLLLA